MAHALDGDACGANFIKYSMVLIAFIFHSRIVMCMFTFINMFCAHVHVHFVLSMVCHMLFIIIEIFMESQM